MANNTTADVRQTVATTAKSVSTLWTYLIVLGSFVSFFGNAVISLTIFEVLIGLYRLPANILYETLGWPPGLRPPLEVQFIRDVTTVALVALVATGFKLNKAWKAYQDERAALLDANRAPPPPSETAPAGLPESIGGGALTGLIIGGPLGALIGAGAASLLHWANNEAEKATPAAPPRRNVEAELAEARMRHGRSVLNRLVFCLFVGSLVIGLAAVADDISGSLDRWDTRINGRLDDLKTRLANANAEAAGTTATGEPASAAVPAPAPAEAAPPAAPASRHSPAPPPTKASPKRDKAEGPRPPPKRTTSVLEPPNPPPLPLPPVAVIEASVELAKPSLINDSWPSRAYARGQPGSATLRCWVTPEARLEDCEVLSESPAGWDFGAAALKVVAKGLYTAQPKTANRQPVRGPVTFVVRFGKPRRN